MVHWTCKIYLFLSVALCTLVTHGLEPPLPKNYKGSLTSKTESVLDKASNKKNDVTLESKKNTNNRSSQKDLKKETNDLNSSISPIANKPFDANEVPTLDETKIDEQKPKAVITKDKKTIIEPKESTKSNYNDVKQNSPTATNTNTAKSNISDVTTTNNKNNNHTAHDKTNTKQEKKEIDQSLEKNITPKNNLNPTISVKNPTNKNKINKVKKSDTRLNLNKSNFIRDETMMLEMWDGDVVNGKITEKARIEMMSAYEYIKEFENQFTGQKSRSVVDEIHNYVLNYNDSFLNTQSIEHIKPSKDRAIQGAIRALVKDNMTSFKAIIDNYPILNAELEHGNNFLHLAVLYNKLDFARYLLSKGINDKKQNHHHLTPFMIADLLRNIDMVRLMLNAEINASKYF